jgi:hypothetical protein
MGKPIYVEIPIRAPLEELWRHTQSPGLHQRWDLRFARIAYLPRPDPSLPQRFLYETRILRGTGRLSLLAPVLRVADVREWFDDASDRFRIEVVVTNRTWGRLFGYRGWFTAEWPPCSSDGVPSHVRPAREERRE